MKHWTTQGMNGKDLHFRPKLWYKFYQCKCNTYICLYKNNRRLYGKNRVHLWNRFSINAVLLRYYKIVIVPTSNQFFLRQIVLKRHFRPTSEISDWLHRLTTIHVRKFSPLFTKLTQERIIRLGKLLNGEMVKYFIIPIIILELFLG